MATGTTALVTVEEFRKLKDPPGVRLELHNGEVIKVTRPNLKHWMIQTGLAERLNVAVGSRGRAGTEFPFRPQPEHQLRVADVAWVSRERLRQTLKGDLLGAPEIVVEMLSPSNTSSEMLDKKHLCFEAGCEEFWIVDPRGAFIEIERKGGILQVYRGMDQIAVGDRAYSVQDILSEGGDGE